MEEQHELAMAILETLGLPDGRPPATRIGRIDDGPLRSLAADVLGCLATPSPLAMDTRLLADEQELSRDGWAKSRIGEGQVFHTELVGPAIDRSVRDGDLLAVDSVDEKVLSAMLVRESLEYTLSALAWVNAYVTSACTSNFGWHRDRHDTLIVQLLGTKRWLVAAGPDDGQTGPDDAEHMELRPGSVLLVPGGTPHDVSGVGEFTLHLTIGFDPDASLSFWAQAADRLLDRPTTQLSEREASRAKARLEERRRGTSLPFSVTREVVDCERVRWASRLPPHVEERGEVLNVLTLGAEHDIAMRWEPAVAALLSGGELQWEDLLTVAKAEPDELLEFVGAGVDAGYLLTRLATR